MTVRPHTVDELQDLVRHAAQVRVRGGGTKSSHSDDVVELSALAGSVDYAPEECVFTAPAATPLREIVALLDAHRQYLPFDPPFVDEGATIGGTVAAGINGPGRYRYGGVRDFLIGVRVIDGEGRSIRSGGKVVKNAAGFLLHHGVVGSYGRFGVLTEVTFKVFPAPEARRSINVPCEDADAAFAVARHVEQLRADCESIDFDERGELRITVAGRAEVIEARADRLRTALATSVPNLRPHGSDLRPRDRGQRSGTEVAHVVKVAGVMRGWHKLRREVTSAQFMCAGAVAWLSTGDLARLDIALQEAGLVGQVFRGPQAGARIGHVVHNEFEARVRRVLDPQDRFSAAPHTDR